MEKGILKKSNVLAYMPETLLLIGGIVCLLGELMAGSSATLLSGLMIFGILAILALLIWKNKYLALAIAIILGCVGLFFALAVLSEYHEFPAGSQKGLQLLLVGGLIFGGLIGISIQMPKKYFNSK